MAKNVVKKDNLGYLGDSYQEQLVKYFIEDKTFFKNIEPIVDQNMFTDERFCKIVGYMKDRYRLNETVPNYEDLELIARSKINDGNTLEIILATLKRLRDDVKFMALDLLTDQCEKFFKQQNLVKAINKAKDIVQLGDPNRYDETISLFEKVLEVNTKKDNGFRIFDNFDEAFSDSYRVTMTTGSNELDRRLMGGIAKGELGVIIAPSGVGKTSATTGFAAAAAIQKCRANNNKGWKVLHIFFEDDDVNIKRKYYAYLTGVESCNLSVPEYRDYAKNLLNGQLMEQRRMIQENIVAMHEIDHELSASDIKQKIKHMIATGFKPDLVIIDYFECLKLEKPETQSDTEWTREALTMRKLEAIAHEMEVGIWCPVQGTKESVDKDYISMAMAGGSFKKVQIAQIVMSFAKTPDQKAQNLMNVILNKFRAGAIVGGGRITDIEFNNGTCRFGLCRGDDVDIALDEYDNDVEEVVKQMRNRGRQ